MLKLLPLLIGAFMAGEILTPLPADSSFAGLGGALENYAPVVDPRTDLDAKAGNTTRLLAAQMTRCLPRAWLTFSSGSSPAQPAIDDFESVWGAVPEPVITRNLAAINGGEYWVTFPASVTVEGKTVALNLRFAMATIMKADAEVHAKITAPNIVNVKTKVIGGSGTSDAGAGELITLMVR